MKRISRCAGVLVVATTMAPAAMAVEEPFFPDRPGLVSAAVDPGSATAMLDAAAIALRSASHQSTLEFGARATFGGKTTSYRVTVADALASATDARGTSSEVLDGDATVLRYVVKGDRIYQSKAGARPVVYTKGQVPYSWVLASPTGFLRMPPTSALSNWVEISGETAPLVRYRATIAPETAKGLFGALLGSESDLASLTAAVRFERAAADVVLDPTGPRLVTTFVDLDATVPKDVVASALGVAPTKATDMTFSFRTKFTPRKVGYAVAPVVVPVGAITPLQAKADAEAHSVLRNAAIAMEVHFSDNQSFVGATPRHLRTLDATIAWKSLPVAFAAQKQVQVIINRARTAYTLRTKSASGATFIYARDPKAAVKRICRLPSGVSCGIW